MTRSENARTRPIEQLTTAIRPFEKANGLNRVCRIATGYQPAAMVKHGAKTHAIHHPCKPLFLWRAIERLTHQHAVEGSPGEFQIFARHRLIAQPGIKFGQRSLTVNTVEVNRRNSLDTEEMLRFADRQFAQALPFEAARRG